MPPESPAKPGTTGLRADTSLGIRRREAGQTGRVSLTRLPYNFVVYRPSTRGTCVPIVVGMDTDIEPGMTGDRMLRTADLAQVFGVDTTTIRRWCVSLELPHERLRSGQRRYRLSEVRAWYRSGIKKEC